MKVVIAGIVAALLWIGKLVLEREYDDWSRRVARRFVGLAVRLLDRKDSERMRREWEAELDAGGGLAFAACLPWGAVARRFEVARVRLRTLPSYDRHNPIVVAGGLASATGAVVVLGDSPEWDPFVVVSAFLTPVMVVAWSIGKFAFTGRFVPALALGTGLGTASSALVVRRGDAALIALAAATVLCGAVRAAQLVERRAGFRTAVGVLLGGCLVLSTLVGRWEWTAADRLPRSAAYAVGLLGAAYVSGSTRFSGRRQEMLLRACCTSAVVFLGELVLAVAGIHSWARVLGECALGLAYPFVLRWITASVERCGVTSIAVLRGR